MNARFTELELRWLKISLGRQWRLATRPFIVPSQRTIVTKMIARQSTQADENSFYDKIWMLCSGIWKEPNDFKLAAEKAKRNFVQCVQLAWRKHSPATKFQIPSQNCVIHPDFFKTIGSVNRALTLNLQNPRTTQVMTYFEYQLCGNRALG